MTHFRTPLRPPYAAPSSSWNVPKDFPDPERSVVLHRQMNPAYAFKKKQTTQPPSPLPQQTPVCPILSKPGCPDAPPINRLQGRRPRASINQSTPKTTPSSELNQSTPAGRRPGNKPQPVSRTVAPRTGPRTATLHLAPKQLPCRRHCRLTDSKTSNPRRAPSTPCSFRQLEI
ncbi:hypothetical protein JTE90_015346 [Oedothorax gibbosus]|uniref:Uncharacterized protein n=1 Tax=Oedothorax gibbosus TaxID=931172 RepID=A0AAV6TM68_9ARAC|nr:hypothetical protein JTE90_015346 [Oedothorax gibbosus]